MTTPEQILAFIDQGLQNSGELDYNPGLKNPRCWRCDKDLAVNKLGLCVECDDWLHEDLTIAPGTQLHPTGTLPEDIHG